MSGSLRSQSKKTLSAANVGQFCNFVSCFGVDCSRTSKSETTTLHQPEIRSRDEHRHTINKTNGTLHSHAANQLHLQITYLINEPGQTKSLIG